MAAPNWETPAGRGCSCNKQNGRCSFLKKRTKRLLRVLSRTSQAAPTPEVARVFCFFSPEKKTFPFRTQLDLRQSALRFGRLVLIPAQMPRRDRIRSRMHTGSKALSPLQVYVPPGRAAAVPGKVFWFFSSERNALPPSAHRQPMVAFQCLLHPRRASAPARIVALHAKKAGTIPAKIDLDNAWARPSRATGRRCARGRCRRVPCR